MSLTKDIYNAFEKSMSGAGELTGQQRANVESLSKDLSAAIVKFLVSQEFRITKIKSKLDVESIETSGNIPATVKPETTMGQYKPLLDAMGLIPGVNAVVDQVMGLLQKNPVVKKVGKDGVEVPALNLKKNFGDGGTLSVKGSSIINEPSNIKSPTGLSKLTTVKLFENDVKDK